MDKRGEFEQHQEAAQISEVRQILESDRESVSRFGEGLLNQPFDCGQHYVFKCERGVHDHH